MITVRLLFYLLLFLLPVQLGRHYFFPFSFLSGVRSDYLAPTIYLTDIIAGLLITVCVFLLFHRPPLRPSGKQLFFFFLFCSYIVWSSIFHTPNRWGALYRSVKLLEWVLVGYGVVLVHPRLQSISRILSGTVIFSSLLAIVQFVEQRSIGGWLWWVGERSFSVSTPGIATMTLGGQRVLRAYGTFAHPNVLGGFLAITVVLLAFHLRRLPYRQHALEVWWSGSAIFLGLVALSYTGSRSAGCITVAGLVCSGRLGRRLQQWARYHSTLSSCLLGALIIGTAVFPLIWPDYGDSWQERTRLTNSAVQAVITSPWIGSGLNAVFPKMSPFQPVHSVFLLLTAELGVLGIAGIGWALVGVLRQSFRSSVLSFVLLVQWMGLGLFDHYTVTLQQGMILTMLVVSLVFLSQTSYTDKTQ